MMERILVDSRLKEIFMAKMYVLSKYIMEDSDS
jgi:hypothetical protein